MFGTKKSKKCGGCGEVHEKDGDMMKGLLGKLFIESTRKAAKEALDAEVPLIVFQMEGAVAVDARIKDKKMMRKVFVALFQEEEIADIAREILDEDEE